MSDNNGADDFGNDDEFGDVGEGSIGNSYQNQAKTPKMGFHSQYSNGVKSNYGSNDQTVRGRAGMSGYN